MFLSPTSQKLRIFCFFRAVLVYKKKLTQRARESHDRDYADMSYNAVTESVSRTKSISKKTKIQRAPELSEDYTYIDFDTTTDYVDTHLEATSQKQHKGYLHPPQISTELSAKTESQEFLLKTDLMYEESENIYTYEHLEETDAEIL